jgi:hypothetical protein
MPLPLNPFFSSLSFSMREKQFCPIAEIILFLLWVVSKTFQFDQELRSFPRVRNASCIFMVILGCVQGFCKVDTKSAPRQEQESFFKQWEDILNQWRTSVAQEQTCDNCFTSCAWTSSSSKFSPLWFQVLFALKKLLLPINCEQCTLSMSVVVHKAHVSPMFETRAFTLKLDTLRHGQSSFREVGT